MHRGISRDIVIPPFLGGTVLVVPLQRSLVVMALVTENLPPFSENGIIRVTRLEKEVPVVVANLMPEMAHQGAVRLAEAGPHLLPVRVIGFQQVQGDNTIVVARQDREFRSGAE